MIASPCPTPTGSLSQAASYVQCQTSDMVRRNPAMSMLVLFGVGVAIGALIGEAIPMQTARPVETTFERIGRQLCDAFNVKF